MSMVHQAVCTLRRECPWIQHAHEFKGQLSRHCQQRLSHTLKTAPLRLNVFV